MIGFGTIINVVCVLVGGFIGLLFGKRMTQQCQDTLMKANGLCILFVGLAGALENMLVLSDGTLSSTGTMMIVACFAVGTLIGEAVDLELRMEQFGQWLKAKTGNGGDSAFVNAFVTCSLTVCVGAMAVVGSIQDGILGDWSTLAVKGVMDLIIVCVMSASMGKGCMFSAIPIALFQGSITVLARFIQPLMTQTALSYLSLTGSMLIFCVGVNLIWDKRFKTGNMLPTVVVAVVWALLEPIF